MTLTPTFILNSKSIAGDQSGLPSTHTKWPESFDIPDRFILNWAIGLDLKAIRKRNNFNRIYKRY